MSETVKKDNKRNKKLNSDEIKKPERSVRVKHLDFDKGFVVTDDIRKEINSCERKLKKTWNEKYNYLTGEHFRQVLAEECANAEIPANTFEPKTPKNSIEKSPIPLKPSPMPIPTTSSAIIGWRSSRREYDLEFIGPLYVSRKHTIEPPPLMSGEFRVTQQKFIFLG